MPSDTRANRLCEDFPELLEADVNWDKEVYAHFGLLFSGYALLEASLQNCFVFRELKLAWDSNVISDSDGWENRYEELEKKAFSLTLGNLIKAVEGYPEFRDLVDNLRLLKKKRDYFAHHFFREELQHLLLEERKPNMIAAMNDLRHLVRQAEHKSQNISETMVSEVRPSLDVRMATAYRMEVLKEEFRRSGHGVKPVFGWENIDAL